MAKLKGLLDLGKSLLEYQLFENPFSLKFLAPRIFDGISLDLKIFDLFFTFRCKIIFSSKSFFNILTRFNYFVSYLKKSFSQSIDFPDSPMSPSATYPFDSERFLSITSIIQG